VPQDDCIPTQPYLTPLCLLRRRQHTIASFAPRTTHQPITDLPTPAAHSQSAAQLENTSDIAASSSDILPGPNSIAARLCKQDLRQQLHLRITAHTHITAMAAADVAARPQTAERPSKRRPFAAWVKRFTSLKGGEQNGSSSKEKKTGNTLTGGKHKKGSSSNDKVKNNPYPESGFVRQQSPISSRDDQLSLATPVHPRNDDGSSVISGGLQERENHPSNRSKAPTVATIPDTVHSDTGHSKAFTGTTGGALSSIDGAGNGSTFSSPNHSNQSLTTTLTTIQSTSPANTLQPNTTAQTPQGQNLTQPTVMFSHQYPVSPAPSNLNSPPPVHEHRQFPV
jgi:hypothetical protein